MRCAELPHQAYVATLLTPHAALLHKPFSLLVALSVRGDLLLPKPKVSVERSEEDAALLAEDAAPSTPQVAEERLGQRMRRLLEHYVGSEARSDGLAGRRLSRPPSGPPAL